MSNDHRFMRYVLLLALVACAEKRNAAVCLENTCSDPDRPFCDLDGTIGGEPNACIAVDCTPGEVAGCREDRALTCNTAGKNYDLVNCPYGCDESGCKPCNTSECEKHIIPRYLPTVCDELWDGDPVTLSANATIDTTSDLNCADVVSQPGGVDICVLRYSTLTIATNQTLSVVGSRPIALVADYDLKIDGILDVSANGTTSGPGGGVIVSGACASGVGGGGGAGYRTMGGSGGGSDGAGGGPSGPSPASLLDLRGGTRAQVTSNECRPGGAGGAVTLVSCRGTVSIPGMIDAGGGGGVGNTSTQSMNIAAGGGGAGGTIVLQGMMIDATGQFYANGGGGGGVTIPFGAPGADGPRSTGNAAGGSGAGDGGKGGSGTFNPTNGRETATGSVGGGGGGGSAGFFLTYTPSGVQPIISPAASSPGFLSNGTIPTN
jgi:hypothetical protein